MRQAITRSHTNTRRKACRASHCAARPSTSSLSPHTQPALAAMFDPDAATANLRRLEALGARGEMGFVEAVDFTPDRQTGDSTS